MDRSKEYILCAAIWYRQIPLKKKEIIENPINVDYGAVFCGYRHDHCKGTMVAVTGIRSVLPEVGEYVQGFLTNKNRFVDRAEAAEIARSAEQVASDVTYLYSEDLY